jgi:hypothetical protein
MRKIREILRLKWVAHRSHRETARSLGVSPGAVASVVGRARATALTGAAVEGLSDDALERTLYGAPPAEIDGMMRVDRILRDDADAGAVNAQVALWGFVDEHTFLTRASSFDALTFYICTCRLSWHARRPPEI